MEDFLCGKRTVPYTSIESILQATAGMATASFERANYPYTPLNEGEIRILGVDRTGRGDHKMFSHVPLLYLSDDAQSDHWALSYTWGDTAATKEIRIDGHTAHISHSLHDALAAIVKAHMWQNMRLNKPGSRYLLLWADQICINQDDIAEKNRQVAMMTQIYQKAELVLVWLPSGRKHRNCGTSTWLRWLCGDGKPRGTSRVREPETAERWDQILDIVQNTWWGRAWIYQEFMLGKKVTFLVDTHLISWTQLRALLQFYQAELTLSADVENGEHDTAKQKLAQDWPRSFFFRCHLCHRVKGIWLLQLLFRDPSIWWTLLLCLLTLWFLPEGMWRKTVAYVIASNTCHSRRSILNFYSKISRCECVVGPDDNPTASYCPRLARWKQRDFYYKWLLSIMIDRVSWWQVYMIFLHGFVGMILAAYGHTQMGKFQFGISLMAASNIWMAKLPEREYNDSTAEIIRLPECSSWENIDVQTRRFWKLALSILDQRAAGPASLTLSTVIEHARITRSSDPRDKVYAFLGLMGFAAYQFNVDYAKSNKIEDVLTEAAEQIVAVDGRLDFLRLAIEDRANGFDDGELPSWVPNWSRPRVVPRSSENHHTSLEDLKTQLDGFRKDMPWVCRFIAHRSGYTNPAITFRTLRNGRRVLQVQALQIDTLGRAVDRYIFFGQRFGHADISPSNTRVFAGDEVWLVLGSEMLLILRNTRLISASEYVFGTTNTRIVAENLPRAAGALRTATYKLVGEAMTFATLADFAQTLTGGQGGKALPQVISIR
ncbi:uncharacterized protein RCC_05044 [Ramularia collo-cygni]|uniref:Heterokaryon incompatibility domain-containing protein n=1 Tax=Ramularia collo-cygni TaxID=112498 RepID=A0A2D3UVB0_9PEZI|nr:uncharacterized protein RCC_05044 [Ramularia collo-cygni]CZT19198.1 uncharacterized protein RCC_05044 [Ramularia collo-cygni]